MRISANHQAFFMVCYIKQFMIYEPAEDSFMLKHKISNLVSKGMKVLDMGCGSGILAQEALDCGAEVLAADINPDAVKFCKKLGIKAVVSDLFSNISKEKFDLITFNPPYLPRDEIEDEESALVTTGGDKGNEILGRFLKEAGNFLNKDGKLLFIASSLTPDVDKLLADNNYNFKVVSEKPLFFEKLRVCLAQNFQV